MSEIWVAHHLAILTKDHRLNFSNFEGEIPDGEYGAGKIIVWDRGSYQNITTKDGKKISIQEAFQNGEITISLKGEKLKGNFSLILLRHQNEPKNWLLIKQDDQYADNKFDPIIELPNSVISHKDIEEI